MIKKIKEILKQKLNRKKSPGITKILYACPLGEYGMQFAPKIIKKFNSYPNIQTDFLLFDYENSDFSSPIFQDCEVISGAGIKWELIRKHVTPSRCKNYDLIFLWDDDIDIKNFSLAIFVDVFFRNALEMGQPTLTWDSYRSHKITRRNKKFEIGRYTDFVEIMIPVFTREAWERLYPFLDENVFWGWGIDDMARSICGFKRMGLVDCQRVKHTRPTGDNHKAGYAELDIFLPRFKGFRKATKEIYGPLK